MNVVDLIERREFRKIYNYVKRKKLKQFAFCFSRYRNLYKGKISKYLEKIWKKIINETKYYYEFEHFDFVNFQYVYEFLKNNLSELDKQKSRELKCSLSEHLQKFDEENYVDDWLKIINEKGNIDKGDKNKGIVDVFLLQLVYILKYNIDIRQLRNREKTQKNVKNNDQKISEKEPYKIINKFFLPSSSYENLIIINENNEYEILFSIIHPYISNKYVTNLVNQNLKTTINTTEVFLQYIIYGIYKIYMNNRNILFYYFLIYKQVKKIKKNILNKQELLMELKIAKLIKHKFQKIINHFKILRTTLLNIADSFTIHNYTKYICTFLYESVYKRKTKKFQKKFQKNYITYKQKENFYEFCFFVYLSIEDLCEQQAAELFCFNYLKIKNFFKIEHDILFDLYLFVHFINAGTCETSLKVRLMLLSFIKWVSLSMKNNSITSLHSQKVKNRAEEDFFYDEKNTKSVFESSHIQMEGGKEDTVKREEKDEKEEVEEELKRAEENFLRQMEDEKDFVNVYLKVENFYDFHFVLKYMKICFYNLINYKNEIYIKYDHIFKEENGEGKKQKKEKKKEHNFEKYSSMTFSSNYVSIHVEKDTASKYMISIIAILLHLQLINLNDIWSFTVSNSLMNNFFFQLLNLLKIRNKVILFQLAISTFLKCHFIFISNFLHFRSVEKEFNTYHLLSKNAVHQKTEKEKPEEDVEDAEKTIRFFRSYYKHPVIEEFLSKLCYLREEIKEFSKNEIRVLFLLSCYSLDLSKYMLRLPLIVWKFLFKQILKFLVKPIHDMKMSIEVFFQNSCLRVAHYIFELIYVISVYIYYVIQTLENQQEYYQKYIIFSFFFNLIDVYVRFTEKYNRQNNTCLMSFLDVPYTHLFLLMFDYSSSVELLMTSVSDSHLLLNRSNEFQNMRITKKYLKYYLTVSEHNIYGNVRHEGYKGLHDANRHKTGDGYQTVKEIFDFLENNNNLVNCFIYTLLMYTISSLHLSNHYRIREMNYLAFLHILPWKSCLYFCVSNSLFSSYFFQKFYETLHYILPELDVEQGMLKQQLQLQLQKHSEVKKTEELKNYIQKKMCDGCKKEKSTSHEAEQAVKEGGREQWEHSDSDDSVEESKCKEFMSLDLDQLNVYEQIAVAKTFIKIIFFSKEENSKLVDISYLNKVCKNNIFRSFLLLLTFIQIKLLKKRDKMNYKINDIISFIMDRRISAYYISFFQNPMNFFLNCSKRFVRLLIQKDCMDSMIALIFAKFQNYLSLVPPQTTKQGSLPIAVEDIAILQETAVSQFMANLEGNSNPGKDTKIGEAKHGKKTSWEHLQIKQKHAKGKNIAASASRESENCNEVEKEKKEGNDEIEKKEGTEETGENEEYKNACAKEETTSQFIFEDLSFFFKKMKGIINSFNPECWNNICESGFNLHSAFYISFYLNPFVFANIFSYFNNNIIAICKSGYNLNDNIKFCESVKINAKEYSLKPFNVIDKTVFYSQIIVFYLIINLNNESLNISNYSVQFNENFNKCLETHTKEYVDKLIIALMPIMLQFFYFFPTTIPNTLILINRLCYCNDEFLSKSASFAKSLKNIMESAYCNEKK